MSIRKHGGAWLLMAALGMVGCGDDDEPGPSDAGELADADSLDGGPVDARVADGSAGDSSAGDGSAGDGSAGDGSTNDGSSGDSGSPCAASMAMAASTVGCNGGFAPTTAAMNTPGGRCTPGGEATPQGSCTTEGAICSGDLAGTELGWCTVLCMAPTTFVDAQECPTGFRCFRMGTGTDAFGMCYRDCDATHPCQEGWTCDAQGRCQEEAPAT